MFYKEEQQIGFGTTYEQQQLLWELGFEFYGWMQECTGLPDGDTLDEAIESLAVDDDDVYEIVVRIHLVNQEVIELHNHCFKNVTNPDREYLGDAILVYSMDDRTADEFNYNYKGNINFKPLVELRYFDKHGIFHQSKLPISQVCYIDAYSVELDWKKLWNELSHEERECRRKAWLKYRKEYNERMNKKHVD